MSFREGPVHPLSLLPDMTDASRKYLFPMIGNYLPTGTLAYRPTYEQVGCCEEIDVSSGQKSYLRERS